ncbi:CIA30 family protein [Salibaculum sp.]|uniref:CIA30 family protein n=1 Tax=Salibaculum sp. TaxID=2855480 RepID=UPI002B4954E0|nr:CIA30 family protein [Salibaculum sp.]HKL70672.1 CIA30 family protein [Salibaculum sp.]
MLVALAGSPGQADMLIDDFTDDPAPRWSFFTDRVMGGRSDGQAVIGGTPPHLHLTGTVSTANNGGFIQARQQLDGLPATVTRLTLTVRGDGQTYYVHLRSSSTRLPWQFYQASFTAPPDWSDVVIALEDFRPSGGRLAPLDPADIRAVALVAYGREHEADLRVSRIGAD